VERFLFALVPWFTHASLIARSVAQRLRFSSRIMADRWIFTCYTLIRERSSRGQRRTDRRSLERGNDRLVDRLIFSSRRLVAPLLPVAGGSDSLL